MTTKQKAESNVAHNNFIDRVMMGAASAVLLVLAYDAALKHVRASAPVNYGLAAGFVAFLAYMIVAPLFRK